MNKRLAIIIAFILGLGLNLVSCGSTGELETGYTVFEISEKITNTQVSSYINPLTPEDLDFSDYLSVYGLKVDFLEDGAISYVGGTSASEVAVFKLEESTEIGAVEEKLENYIQLRTGSFYGYMPGEAYVLEQAVIATKGNYVALLICEEPKEAEAAFLEAFQREQDSREVLNIDMSLLNSRTGGDSQVNSGVLYTERLQNIVVSTDYDHDAILEAWNTGDASALSEKDRTILDAASQVIDELITNTMRDYEKELAIHDWMVQWTEFDAGIYNRLRSALLEPDNDDPYGVLIKQRAICTGYSATFQLFMDMLEIECLTIEGTSYNGLYEHTWNMVRLDGNWYHVDVSWDDPSGVDYADDRNHHQYFNATDQYMAETSHQWDRDTAPEATATTYWWNPWMAS